MHGEAAVIVNRIRGIDRTLDRLERARASLRGTLALPAGRARDSDGQHARLLEERAGLVRDLRSLVGDAG